MQPYFERGIEAEIAIAKKLYRRQYKAAWRKENRKTIKEITLQWTKEEFRVLQQEVKKHKESITKFVKRATLGYMDKTYVVPSHETIYKLLVTFTLCYNRLEELLEEDKLEHHLEKEVRETIEALEREVRISILAPKTIEQTINDYLKANLDKRNHLLNYIQQCEP
jgi:hypothetical protein